MSKVVWFASLAVAFTLAGCTLDTARPGNPEYAPAMPEGPSRADSGHGPHKTGGLYHTRTALNFFETMKAKRVGDIITVVMQENTLGISEGESEATKTTSTTLQNPFVLGSFFDFPKQDKLPFLTNRNAETGNVSLNGTSNFDGTSDSQQRNQLNGIISATVSEVLGNGNLVIRGEKWIQVSSGKEYIRIKGIVRPRDVTPDNTISSQKIADARLFYSGAGQSHQQNVMGWLTKFFTSALWLI